MAFRELRDVSINVKNELCRMSFGMDSAKIGKKIEDDIGEKLRDIALFSSKLKLLRGSAFALTPKIAENVNDNAVHDYGEVVASKLLEQMTVKSLTQGHAVRQLITTPDTSLDPEHIRRKEAIIKNIRLYCNQEKHLGILDGFLKEREAELATLRSEWDKTLGGLRDVRGQQIQVESRDNSQEFMKLTSIVDKMEVMRTIIARLVRSRNSYDWLANPHNRLYNLLAITRSHNTVDMFLDM